MPVPESLNPAAAAPGPGCELLSAADLGRWLAPRPRDSHKGRNGRVLCIGGAPGHGGAILLAAEAALRSGAGLVDVLTDRSHIAPLLARAPEAMGHAADDDDGTALAEALSRAADVIAIGPGLGMGARARALLEVAISSGRPLVVDADGLNLVAQHGQPVAADCILTPHPGEAARLLGCDAAAVQADRVAATHELADCYRACVVLKGAGTLVAAPGERLRQVQAGNPGMAVGGMGDVLAGVIAALRAQGLGAFDAASCGALLHACAGDAAAADGERGLLPRDLMPWLRRLANPGAAA